MNEVRMHLVRKGFVDNYYDWRYHNTSLRESSLKFMQEQVQSTKEPNENSTCRSLCNEQNENSAGRSSREHQSTNKGDVEVVTSSDEEDTRPPLPWIKSQNRLCVHVPYVQKYWKWPSKITPHVCAAWNLRAGRCYGLWLSEERKKIKSKKGCYKPKWIEEGEWNKLKACWDSKEFMASSKIKAKNRRRGVEGGQADATYGGGSQSTAKVMDKMAKDEGRQPLAYELFLQTHETTDAKGNKIGFINNYAESLSATYLMMIEEAEKANDTPNYNAIYLKAFLKVMEQKKKKSLNVYGIRSTTQCFYPDYYHSLPCESSQATPSHVLISERIMKEFDEKAHHIREELIRLSGTIDRIGNQVDRVETMLLDSMSTQVKVQTFQSQMAQLQSDQNKICELFEPYITQLQNAQDSTTSSV